MTSVAVFTKSKAETINIWEIYWQKLLRHMVQLVGPNEGVIARCYCILIKLWQQNTVGDTDDKGRLPRTSQSQTHSGALQFNKPSMWHQGGSHLICWLTNLHTCCWGRYDEESTARPVLLALLEQNLVQAMGKPSEALYLGTSVDASPGTLCPGLGYRDGAMAC